MTVESEFLNISVDHLLKSMARIEACVSELSPAQIWVRHSANENSVGNLLLHLRGNVTQWILSGVCGMPFERDRDGEFDATSGADAPQLVADLRQTVTDAVAVIRSVSPERLLEKLHVQVYDVNVLGAIYHVVEHFSGHTFQIIYATKWLTGKDMGFYAHLREGNRSAADPNVP
jgi:hypothetical protein